MIIWVVKLFLYSFSVYSCLFFLISSVSVRSTPFISFIEAIFARNIPLVSLFFLKWSLIFSILLFSSIIYIDGWRRLSYLCLLFFGTRHSDAYIFPFVLCSSLLFFSQLFLRPPQTWSHTNQMNFFFCIRLLILNTIFSYHCKATSRSQPTTWNYRGFSEQLLNSEPDGRVKHFSQVSQILAPKFGEVSILHTWNSVHNSSFMADERIKLYWKLSSTKQTMPL